MASHDGSAPPPEADGHNPYASANRWRHQESSAFLRHAAANPQGSQARDAHAAGTGTTGDLANFLNKDRVEPEGDPAAGGHFKPITVAAGEATSQAKQEHTTSHGVAPDGKEIVCGPLLNYRYMDDRTWYGSVLVVVKGGGSEVLFKPTLALGRAGRGQLASGTEAETNGASASSLFESDRLYSDSRNTFWAFDIEVPIEATESQWEYSIPDLRFSAEHKPRVNSFFVPAADQSMRVMFHSCNGFSVGTDEDAWSGACLWNDVNRKHKQAPFHVMLGGGDQIYNDGIRVNGPLRAWTDEANPKKRRDFPFPEKLRSECDDYYLNNYIRWYNTEPFSTANGQIPQVNIWDDHDVSSRQDQLP